MSLIKKLLTEIIKNQHEILETNKELKLLLDNNTLAKAQKYDEGKKHIKIRANAVLKLDDYGNYRVYIDYTIPSETICFDLENDSVIASDTLRAINGLDYIPLKDLLEIQRKIDLAKKKNQESIKESKKSS